MRAWMLLLLVGCGCGGTSGLRTEAPAGPTRRLALPLASVTRCTRGFDAGDGHYGLDLATAEGEPVMAAAAGTVVRAAPRSDYGRMVILDHGGGLYTLYAHLRAVAVVLGEEVAGGAILGAVGHTGNATGSHLHWEVLRAPGALGLRPSGAIGIPGSSYRVDPAREVPTPCSPSSITARR